VVLGLDDDGGQFLPGQHADVIGLEGAEFPVFPQIPDEGAVVAALSRGQARFSRGLRRVTCV
jgi:hypothetical protein